MDKVLNPCEICHEQEGKCYGNKVCQKCYNKMNYASRRGGVEQAEKHLATQKEWAARWATYQGGRYMGFKRTVETLNGKPTLLSKLRKVPVSQIMAALEAGKSGYEIAQDLGIHNVATLYHYIKKELGINIRAFRARSNGRHAGPVILSRPVTKEQAALVPAAKPAVKVESFDWLFKE